MKKITFEELHKLVANIDYIDEASFPVKIAVNNNGEKEKFEFGIALPFDFLGETYFEQQYAMCNTTNICYDLQDPDCMEFDEIGNMIKKICQIKEDSEIMLYDKHSFNGKGRKIEHIPIRFKTKIHVAKTQDDVCEEVQKGIDWFKKILNADEVLFADNDGKIVNLNEMSGSDFAFFFEKRYTLYFDVCAKTIHKRCPTNYSLKERKLFFDKITSNVQFRWILLNVCNGEDLLPKTKYCYVNVTTLRNDKEEAREFIINEDSVNTFIGDTIQACLAKAK